ncbi:unnamed protein product [[Candida] boidinii]|uniref:Unnamed protein product n=1 Tax=Candida boidinii TaxID=5477 RepID=A0A9W6SZV3_CANBO|nr:unnamed protein product [[Candida] boidinii]GMG01642.1 unnamed protein product [[Candida] boidinii]
MTTVKETKDQSLMEIGKHCQVCHRIDFLPFTCQLCKVSFCQDHRLQLNDHECSAKKILKTKKERSTSPSSDSVFPDMQKIRDDAQKEYEKKQAKVFGGERLGKNSNSIENKSSLPLEAKSDPTSNALAKLRRFLAIRHKKSNSKSGSSSKSSSSTSQPLKFSLFSSSKTSTSKVSKNTQRILELSQLKKNAQGDPKLSPTQRVHFWIQYIPDDESFDKVKNRVPMYVSKAWPIGRLLDYASDELKIKNENNKTNDSTQRLTIFRDLRRDEIQPDSTDVVYVPANGRVIKEVLDGDMLYLVKGAHV